LTEPPDERSVELPPELPPELRRLAWRCRRGMRELDVLLDGFLRQEYTAASDAERRAFEALLDLPDPCIIDCLLAPNAPPEPGLAALARRLTRRGTDTNW
jgi:antitoxin CptB